MDPDDYRDLTVTASSQVSNKPRLIALTGLAGSGKSTAAKTLLAQGDHWVLIKFADPLKNMMRALYHTCGLSDEHTEDRIEGFLKEEPCPVLSRRSPRYAMQTLGTEWGRHFMDHNFWVTIWDHRVREALASGKNVVVDDCRFHNEAVCVEILGGKIIKVVGRESSDNSGHISEAGGVIAHASVRNDGTVEDLRDKLFDLV